MNSINEFNLKAEAHKQHPGVGSYGVQILEYKATVHVHRSHTDLLALCVNCGKSVIVLRWEGLRHSKDFSATEVRAMGL